MGMLGTLWAAGPRKAGPRPKFIALTVVGKRGVIRVTGCRCRSLWCYRCGRSERSKRRAWMAEVVEKWPDVVTMSLSVDRNGCCGGRVWSSPREVWAFVRENRLVSRLLRDVLGLSEWIAVLEFQKKTGGGWPHWHVLLPRRLTKAELQSVRDWMTDKWGVCGRAGVNLRGRRGPDGRLYPKFSAVRYVTKYLSDPDDLPDWMLSEQGQFFSQGRDVVAFSMWGKSGEPAESVGSSRRVPIKGAGAKRRTLGERVAACGGRSDVAVHPAVDMGDDGKPVFGESERLASLDIRPDVLFRLAKRAGVSCRPEWFFTRRVEFLGVDLVGSEIWVDSKTGDRVADNRRMRHVRAVSFTRDGLLSLLRDYPALERREVDRVSEGAQWTLAGKLLRPGGVVTA
jgi:hypothetical protein